MHLKVIVKNKHCTTLRRYRFTHLRKVVGSIKSLGLLPGMIFHQEWKRFQSWLWEKPLFRNNGPGKKFPQLTWAFPAELLPEQAVDADRQQKSQRFGLFMVETPIYLVMMSLNLPPSPAPKYSIILKSSAVARLCPPQIHVLKS